MMKRTGLPASTVIFAGLDLHGVAERHLDRGRAVVRRGGGRDGRGRRRRWQPTVGLGGRVADVRAPPGVLTGSAPLETRTHPASDTTAEQRQAGAARMAWEGRHHDLGILRSSSRVPRIRTRPAPVSLMVADNPVVHLKVPRGA